MFSQTQKMIAKHFYALLSSMSPEQVEGAVLTLGTLGVLVEDGYLSVNSEGPAIDFYTHSYDTLFGAILSLKMLKDDGVVKEKQYRLLENFDPDCRVKDADLALSRVEAIMKTMVAAVETLQ